jgi:hypothetical protein
MPILHLDFEGKSARIGYGRATAAHPQLTPTARTSTGALATQRVFNGVRQLAGTPTAEELIQGDPELDLDLGGRRLVEELTVAYCDTTGEIADTFELVDEVRDATGAVKEKRPHKQNKANTNLLEPVKTVRRLPEAQVLTNFVFRRVVQLMHEDSLAFDFLYSIAKELDTKKEVALLAAGPKSNQPLVFTEGGVAYRSFLYGRVQGEEYRLVLLLSDRELKLPTASA